MHSGKNLANKGENTDGTPSDIPGIKRAGEFRSVCQTPWVGPVPACGFPIRRFTLALCRALDRSAVVDRGRSFAPETRRTPRRGLPVWGVRRFAIQRAVRIGRTLRTPRPRRNWPLSSPRSASSRPCSWPAPPRRSLPDAYCGLRQTPAFPALGVMKTSCRSPEHFGNATVKMPRARDPNLPRRAGSGDWGETAFRCSK